MTVTTIPSAGITDATIATADIADDAVTAAKAAFSLGKIGQVVSVTHTADQTSTSTSFADVTNLNASITPSATTSKILVLTDIEFYVAGSSQGINGFLKVVRGSTDIVQRRSQSYSQDGTGVEYENQVSFAYLDSPNTTSSTTYKIQFRLGAGSSVSINHSSDKTGSITLMEVLA
jgi:hypothetical protein